MSGHSKWSTIKRQKGAADIKRGQLFTKLANAISIAIKQGGGSIDPGINLKLRLAIDAAKSANMPKNNIERAIQRVAGKELGDIEEVVYEGFGPGGFSVIVEAITDNKQRTTPIIKSIFDRGGGNLGIPGSVSYLFQQRGQILANKERRGLEEIFLIAADSGAEDVVDMGRNVLIYTRPDVLTKIRDDLVQKGLSIESAELIRLPVIPIPVTDSKTAEAIVSFIDKLEEQDDVQKVYVNCDIPEIKGF